MIITTPFFRKQGLTTNYLVTDELSGDALLIDCTDVDMAVINHIEKGKYSLKGVLLTHAHEHHAGGLRKILHIYSPKVFAFLPAVMGIRTECLYGKEGFTCGSFSVKALNIPGHSPDCIVYLIGDNAFTGDVRPGAGRTHRNDELLMRGIREKLATLPDDTVLYPGHGPVSTIGTEKRFSPLFA